MSEALRILASFLGAALLVGALVPLAIRVATRTGFLDRPSGYKAHARVTPYLGGVTVIASFVVVSVLFAEGLRVSKFSLVLILALILAAVGTVDDRRNLGIGIRLAAQVGAAIALWLGDISWRPTGIDVIDLLVTVVWVVGLANAFNLLDNIDGSTSSTAAVAAAGLGILALVEGASVLAVMAFGLSGACVGFLRFNLARPSRIFLGDGGSVPLGFLLASIAMLVPAQTGSATPLLVAVPMVGVAIFDTSLVVVSRLRRGVPVLSGGRDHFTHRLLTVVGSPQACALVLIITQASLVGLGVLMHALSADWDIALTIVYLGLGAALLVRLETLPPAARGVEMEELPA